MTNPDQERWPRVKERLRAEVGEDIFSSWFARMDLERIEGDTVQLSVPTRFLKSWIQSHYTERCWPAGRPSSPTIQRIEVTVRSAVIRPAPPKAKPPEVAAPRARAARSGATAASCASAARRSRPGTTRSAARRSIRG